MSLKPRPPISLFMSALLLGGMLPAMPATAIAHGGMARIPHFGGRAGGNGPPPRTDLPDAGAPPPSLPGTPPEPARTAPGTPPTPLGGSKTPRLAVAPGALTGVRGHRSRRRTASTRDRLGPDSWEVWWAFNQASLTRTDTTDQKVGMPSGSLGHLLGIGATAPRYQARPVSNALYRETILPLLIDATSDKDADIADSAVMALGRSLRCHDVGHDVGHDAVQRAVKALDRALRSSAASVSQAAALAIGLLDVDGPDSTSSNTRLSRLLFGNTTLDTIASGFSQTKPRALRQTNVTSGMRLSAALGLGLAGGQDAERALLGIAASPTRQGDLRVAALLGLAAGQTRDAETLSRLGGLLADRTIPASVRCQIPIALAHTDPSPDEACFTPLMTRLLAASRTPAEMRRSCAIALGRTTSCRDARAIATLRRIAGDEADGPSRHFALIALGRLADRSASDGRPVDDRVTDAAATGSGARDILSFLCRFTVRAPHRDDRPWAALGLGLAVRAFDANGWRGGAPDGEEGGRDNRGRRGALAWRAACARLLTLFETEHNPSHRAASAIALGLAGERGAAPALLEVLRCDRDTSLRRHVAVALGMMGARVAGPFMWSLIREHTLAPALRRDLARAIARLGDAGRAGQLAAMLARAHSLHEAASLAWAIGRLGDAGSVPTLIRLATNTSRPGLLRAFAIVALGILAETTPRAWNAGLAADSNYLSLPSSLLDLLDIM